MKLQIDKDGVLYRSMLRGRTKLTVIFIVLLALFVVYTVGITPYLGKRFFGSVPADEAHYAQNAPLVAVTEAYEPDKNLAKIYGYAQKETSYWNGDKYFFSAELKDLEEIGLAYTISGAMLTPDTDTVTDPVAVKVDFVKVGGVKTAVLYMGDVQITEGMVAEGIFTEISPRILDNLASYIPEGEEISVYMFDIRGIDMSSEFSDMVSWLLYIAILLFLVIKLVIYYLKPEKHPTYRQLEKYGELAAVAIDIDTQVRNGAQRDYKDEIRTNDWIITKRSFYHKVEKNFTAKGTFKYTPYEK